MNVLNARTGCQMFAVCHQLASTMGLVLPVLRAENKNLMDVPRGVCHGSFWRRDGVGPAVDDHHGKYSGASFDYFFTGKSYAQCHQLKGKTTTTGTTDRVVGVGQWWFP
jgi:hypothetical protein